VPPVDSAWLDLGCGSIGVEIKYGNQRKMVGARFGKNSHAADREMFGVEDVVEWISKTREARRVGIEEASSPPWVTQVSGSREFGRRW
jgi:hypothetical protein